ncbi:MAG: metal-dependent transcriptional regulator [Thermoguttaceae bacterium]|jgi:DtxR family Mn-dependent transcriptional regulator
MIQSQTNRLSDSLEDYLEAIYRIILARGQVKPKDIAKAMHVAGASVTGALRALAEKGLINYAPYDEISLTPSGLAIAQDVFSRHKRLKFFLKDMLGVPEREADETACKVEHAVSSETIGKLVRFAEFIESCPRGGRLWISGFEHDCDPEHALSQCRRCVAATLEKIDQELAHSVPRSGLDSVPDSVSEH